MVMNHTRGISYLCPALGAELLSLLDGCATRRAETGDDFHDGFAYNPCDNDRAIVACLRG